MLTRCQLVDSNGMEVFTKYFRRLVQNNTLQVFGTGARSADANGSYSILVSEVQKLRKEPEQAEKIAEAISTSEGETFRDFDLAAFTSHFQLDPVAKTLLALACRRTDLRPKGMPRSQAPRSAHAHTNAPQPMLSCPQWATTCS
jgi:CCR4-NOT transcription complex subunit 1